MNTRSFSSSIKGQFKWRITMNQKSTKTLGDFKSIGAHSLHHFRTNRLVITPDLLGKYHKFNFQGYKVKISLPKTITELDQTLKQGFSLKYEASAYIFGTKAGTNKKIPTLLGVDIVDISVEVPNKVKVHKDMLRNPPNQAGVLSDKQIKYYDSLVDSQSGIANDAFGYWLRVMRWKSGGSFIGRPSIQGISSGAGPYLINNRTKKRIWIGGRTFSLGEIVKIDKQIWVNIAKALKKNNEPPVYYDLLSDAIEHKKISDLQRALVDLAVAGEVFMRSQLMIRLPKNLQPSIKDYVDDASIRKVIKTFFPELLSGDGKRGFKKIKSKLHKIFDERNNILHSGKTQDLLDSDLKKYIEVVEKLIQFEHKSDYWA